MEDDVRYELMRDMLVDARVAADITQVEMGEYLGRPQSFVSKYERGERKLDVIEFVEIVRVTGEDPAKMVRRLAKLNSDGSKW